MKFTKLKSAEQPTTPKPTTTLPDNMTWAWDPKANQWIAVMKDNPVVTPPTYNPNNITNTSNYTSTTYTPIKAANKEKTMQEYEDSGCDTTNLMQACQHIYYGFYDAIKNKWSPEKLLNYMEKRLDNAKNNPDEAKFEKNWATSRFPEAIELVKQFIENCNSKKEIKSTLIDSLNQFLNGDKYSREIKIEKGLISDGLIKLAGINPIKGPKYSITDKGLNLLKQAAQEEYDFEKDYIKAKKSYLLDGISESEFKTGAPETQGKMPKFSIFEKDGSELAQIEAKNSTDAKVKFFMENPEYEGSKSIEVKEIDSAYSETTTQGLDFPNQSVSPSTDIKVDPKGWVNMASENEDKKKSIIKTIVYKKNNQYPNSVNLSLDLDNKAIVTGDFQILSEIEDELRDYGIISSIEPQMEDVYKLTVLFSPKESPTDKFASIEKKATENPIVFSERPEAIKFEIDENYLFKIINQHPKLQGVKLDLSERDQTYTLEYKLSSEVKWDMWFDMRSWGIKEMRPGVMDQTISIDIDYSGEDEAPIKNGMYFSVEVPIKNIKCEIESRELGSNQFFLRELEIKEDSGKATF